MHGKKQVFLLWIAAEMLRSNILISMVWLAVSTDALVFPSERRRCFAAPRAAVRRSSPWGAFGPSVGDQVIAVLRRAHVLDGDIEIAIPCGGEVTIKRV